MKNDLLKKISVLYEDDDVLVINKPAGLVVHADGRTAEPAVTDWVIRHAPETAEVGEPLVLKGGLGVGNYKSVPRPGIVHRIDRETSGVLVIAKNKKTHAFLKKQFKEGAVLKKYLAFVYGEMKNDDGTVDRPIARSRKDFRMWSAQRGARGKERQAVTFYKVLARKGGFSLVEVSPKTGRTHQIRVHLKAINHPVVCDKLYAPKQDSALGFARVALHARSISFTLPNGRKITVEAPYPYDFRGAFKVMGYKLTIAS